MNKNRQHFYCCSLVLAYSFRSWLRVLFHRFNFGLTWTLNYLWPLKLLIKVNKCNRNIANLGTISVPTVNIAKPRRFKATKACHHASRLSRPHTVPPESKLPLRPVPNAAPLICPTKLNTFDFGAILERIYWEKTCLNTNTEPCV